MNSKIQKLEKLFAILLSLWCVGNAIYWEFYAEYLFDNFYSWHSYLYIILSILIALLIAFSKAIIRRLILITLCIELIISLEHLYDLSCFDPICKIISTQDKVIAIPDQANSIVTLLMLIILLFLDLSITRNQRSINTKTSKS